VFPLLAKYLGKQSGLLWLTSRANAYSGRTGLRADACSEHESVRSPVVTSADMAGAATNMKSSHRRSLALLLATNAAVTESQPQLVNKVFSGVVEALGGPEAAASLVQLLEDCHLFTDSFDEGADLVTEAS